MKYRSKKLSPAKKQKIAAKRKIRSRRSFFRKLSLHPITLMLILCVGVFILTWSYEAVADSYTVTVTLPAIPLTEGATITSPADGSILTSQQINVIGTCPANAYVTLTINNLFSGAAWCSNAGAFQIATTLFVGTNILKAQDYNITNQPGPVTPSVSVQYNPPVVPNKPGSAKNPNSSTSSILPLILTTDFTYKTFYAGSDFSWTFFISGGVRPYDVQIQWGDGESSTEIYNVSPTFTIHHIYKTPGYHVLTITGSDSIGDIRVLQIAALIRPAGGGSFTIPGINKTPFVTTKLVTEKSWLWIVWPTFIFVILLLSSYWLGEREEYHKLLVNANARRQLILKSR